MTKTLLLGVSAVALVAGLSLSAAYANPTAKQNDYNVGSHIANITNSVGVDIYQDANANGGAEASASLNAGSWADAWAGGYGGDAGTNNADVYVDVEVGNVALISENDLSSYVTNEGDVISTADGWGYASSSTGEASQNASQQQYAAGTFNNGLSTGLGSSQQQGNTAGVNANSINF